MTSSSKSKETSSMISYVKTYGLPVYIVVSAAFILYVLWSYVMWVVYNSWVRQWQEQALQAWQEQWYVAAFQQISEELTKWCEWVTLTLWDQEINVINTDCLIPQADNIMWDDTWVTE